MLTYNYQTKLIANCTVILQLTYNTTKLNSVSTWVHTPFENNDLIINKIHSNLFFQFAIFHWNIVKHKPHNSEE